jgi:large subunit ribosomal protein L12e
MPPKPGFDPEAVHYIFMKVVGGEVAPAAALAPKCSPIGMPPKKVGEDIQKATKDWKGLKVEVEIRIQNKQSTVTVMPTAAPLILNALKEPARDRKKTKNVVHNGKLKISDVIGIAKLMREKSFSAEFSGTVKEILGTCVSIGCTVDGKDPRAIQKEIDEGTVEVNE